jgi:uncharacterized protein
MLKSNTQTQRDARDEFDNSFEIPLPPAQAWLVLSNIPRIAQCVPGAQLTQVVDETTYRGKISVPFGPVSLAFALQAKFEEIDSVNYTARLKAQGPDDDGNGGADCTLSFRLEPADGGTKVLVHTDLMLSGAAAQFGRDVGMVQAMAGKIMSQFATNLKTQFAAPSA